MNAPFHSLSFTMAQSKVGRSLFRMTEQEDGSYKLHVEKGSATNPQVSFTRALSAERAQSLKDALSAAGVFGWDEEYGDAAAPGQLKWRLDTVFKEGVFSTSSHGGSDVPAGFDDMLQQFYRLDFPRPKTPGEYGFSGADALASQGVGGASLMDALSGSADSAQLGQLLEGLRDAIGAQGGLSPDDMERIMRDMRENPGAMQDRIREEFSAMPRDDQERLLDALAATGMASRAWWEQFFRG